MGKRERVEGHVTDIRTKIRPVSSKKFETKM